MRVATIEADKVIRALFHQRDRLRSEYQLARGTTRRKLAEKIADIGEELDRAYADPANWRECTNTQPCVAGQPCACFPAGHTGDPWQIR